MKLTYKLLVLFIFFFKISFSQEWLKTEITEFASIKFPLQSELTETQNEIVFVSEDENAYYIVSVRKLSDQQSSRISKADIPNLYKGVAQGAIDASNGVIISMNEIEIQNIPALELEYEVSANDNLPNKRFKRIIYSNQNLISIDFWPLKNQKNIIAENKTRFFDSFILKLNGIQNTSKDNTTELNDKTQDNYGNSAYETGFVLGKIIFYLLLITILIGIVILIRLLVKRNRKNKNTGNTETQNETKPLTIICGNCETENNSNSKYCKRCGYQLKK